MCVCVVFFFFFFFDYRKGDRNGRFDRLRLGGGQQRRNRAIGGIKTDGDALMDQEEFENKGRKRKRKFTVFQ